MNFSRCETPFTSEQRWYQTPHSNCHPRSWHRSSSRHIVPANSLAYSPERNSPDLTDRHRLDIDITQGWAASVFFPKCRKITWKNCKHWGTDPAARLLRKAKVSCSQVHWFVVNFAKYFVYLGAFPWHSWKRWNAKSETGSFPVHAFPYPRVQASPHWIGIQNWTGFHSPFSNIWDLLCK